MNKDTAKVSLTGSSGRAQHNVEQAEEKLNEEIQWTHWKRVHGPLTHIDSLK